MSRQMSVTRASGSRGPEPEAVAADEQEQADARVLLTLGPRPIRARFVAATNRDLEQAVEQGGFRRDLYHRIAGLRLSVPPLRERPADILELAEHFVRTSCREPGQQPAALTEGVRAALVRHPWTGNVRELRNVLELAVLFAGDGVIAEEHLRLVKPLRSEVSAAALAPVDAAEPGAEPPPP